MLLFVQKIFYAYLPFVVAVNVVQHTVSALNNVSDSETVRRAHVFESIGVFFRKFSAKE